MVLKKSTTIRQRPQEFKKKGWVRHMKVAREMCLEILKKHANPLNLTIEVEWKKVDNIYCVYYHINGQKSLYWKQWLCFAVILTVPGLNIGLWTRDLAPSAPIIYTHMFEPISFDLWLHTWFAKAVHKALAV